MDDVACDRCHAQRALVHCAEDAARLCLPCDVAAHAAKLAHHRTPLCDGCHAAPAAARFDDGHGAAVCVACARGARRHALSPAAAYTGFPEVAVLARILAVDDTTTAQSPMSSEINHDDKSTAATGGVEMNMPSWPELAVATSHVIGDSSMSSTDVSVQMKKDEAAAPEKVEAKLNRQRAMQRYNEKKKKRRFGCKEIMYASRKATADTRQRVNGRFAKATASRDDVTDLPIQ